MQCIYLLHMQIRSESRTTILDTGLRRYDVKNPVSFTNKI
jgi:hypothetical protein